MRRLAPFSPYLILLAEVLAFFRRVLFSPARWAIPWDLRYFHLPLAWFATRSLSRGELPLWDPHTYCGMPAYANLTLQLFYPPTFAVYLVHAVIGGGERPLLWLLEAQIAAHVFAAGVFTFLLLRRLDASPAAALVAATIYQLGAFFASQTQHLGAMDAAAWLPAAWLATLYLSEGSRWRPLGALASALAMAFLSGFPAVTAVVFGSTFALAVALCLVRRARWTLVASCAAAMLWSAALSAVQLFPTMQLSALSVASLRGQWLGTGGGVPVRALLSMAVPNIWGVFEFGQGEWRQGADPTFLYLYCGIPALILAALALIRRARDPWLWIFAALTAVGLLWMLGDHTPVYRALFPLLPQHLKASLYAEFAMSMFTLGLAVLAGLGAHVFLRSRGPLIQAAVVAITALDLIAVSSARPINTSDRRIDAGMGFDHYDRSPVVPLRMRQLVNQATPPWRIDTMAGSHNWASCASLFEIPTAGGDDPFALVRYMSVRECFTRGVPWGRYYQVRDPDSPVLKLLNVKYVLSGEDLPKPGALLRSEGLPGNVVYENPGVLPRFFLVSRVRHASGMDEAVRLLASPGADLRGEAIVEGAPELTSSGENPSRGAVRVLSYAPREIILETDTEQRAFLVTSESWYPGWRATIDAPESPLVLTNAAFRGLAVPAGKHRITMRFNPAILWRSALVSLTALAALLAAAVSVTEPRP